METKELSRGQFLKQLGLSSGALMAFYCMGTTMTACTKEETTTPATSNTNGTTGGTGADTGVTGITSGGSVDFTIDLAHKDFSRLKTEGEYAYVGDIIISNTKGGTFVALSKICTHEGTTIQYRLKENDFWCSNHSSEFNSNGTVKKSPAAKSLAVFKTESKENGTKLRISV
jgi:cytochrome b6-f complex iron-sulfur subunit